MTDWSIEALKQSVCYQEILKEGREEGCRQIIETQLIYRFGQLSPQNQAKIAALDFEQLDVLLLDLLDFTSSADLENWLERWCFWADRMSSGG